MLANAFDDNNLSKSSTRRCFSEIWGTPDGYLMQTGRSQLASWEVLIGYPMQSESPVDCRKLNQSPRPWTLHPHGHPQNSRPPPCTSHGRRACNWDEMAMGTSQAFHMGGVLEIRWCHLLELHGCTYGESPWESVWFSLLPAVPRGDK